MTRASRIQEVEEAVEERAVSEGSSIGVLNKERLVPTGSTLLNLALSDDPYGGFYLGTIVNIVGDNRDRQGPMRCLELHGKFLEQVLCCGILPRT